jgi:hypothetical protein
VTVTNAAGVAAGMMAEYVLGGFLHFTLDMPGLQKDKAAKHWDTTRLVRPLAGQTLLIVGLGQTGQALAARAKALGMTVIGTRARPQAMENVDEVAAASDLHALLPRAGFVAVCTPLTPATRGLIGAAEFSRMQPGAILADVSRGGVVDGDAAAGEALRNGPLAAAVLDVFETEPLPADEPPLGRRKRDHLTALFGRACRLGRCVFRDLPRQSRSLRTGARPCATWSTRRGDTDVPRIAIAGFQHETNSFATSIAGLAEFEMADAWPSLLTGDEVITGTHGMNLPIAGFAQAARAHPEIELTPILWASAEPSGPVTAEAFDTITGRILDGLHAARADGIYLDLHGAMITERAFDGEGALLRLIREHVGPDLPIAISLDLHANVTNAMVELATSIAIFRTYPHLDMAETGARCLPRLLSHIAGHRPAKALRRVPYLIPLHAQFTGASPARELYGRVAGTQGAELAMGFTGSDMPDTGPAVVIHAEDQATADRTAEDLLDALLEAEGMFPGLPPSANEAVRDALSRPPGKPILIADVEDNAGGGGSSDTTGLLRALDRRGRRQGYPRAHGRSAGGGTGA